MDAKKKRLEKRLVVVRDENDQLMLGLEGDVEVTRQPKTQDSESENSEIQNSEPNCLEYAIVILMVIVALPVAVVKHLRN